MSWRLMERVCGLRLDGLTLSASEFELLILLAQHARDDGTSVFPGLARLARLSGKDERSVQRLLRALEARHLIHAVAYRAGGRGHATEYQVTIPPAGERVTPVS